MSKALVPILAILAAVAVAFAVVQLDARYAAEAGAQLRQHHLAAAEEALREASNAATKAMDELAAEKENVARLKKERDDALARAKQASSLSAAGAAGADAKPQFDLRNALGGFAKAFEDPEQRNAMKSMQTRMVSGAYEKLFKDFGLSEADAKLVSELLGERNFLAMDKGRKLLTGKTDEASVAQIRREIEATKGEYDAKLKAVLGDEKSAKLTAYEQTVGDRRSLDSFSREFERKGQKLDDSQKEHLTAIMTEERLRNPGNEIPDLGGGPGMEMLMSDTEAKARQAEENAYQQRVYARATEAGLTPDQVITLQESQKRQSERRNFSRTMGRAFLMPK